MISQSDSVSFPRSQVGVPLAFIGGFRSGSTLLINLLGLHPGITAWFETKFLSEALRWLRVLSGHSDLAREVALSSPSHPAGFGLEPVTARMYAQMVADDARLRGTSPSGKRDYERYPLGADRIHYSLSDALEALDRWRSMLHGSETAATVACAVSELYRSLGDRHLAAEPAEMLVNKTPELPRFGAELRETVGPHKMILLVRDGRDVVRSAAALDWGEPSYIAALWRDLILQSRDAAQGASRDYLEVRFEDLVSRSRLVLDRVCDFLDIPRQGPEILKAYQDLVGRPIGAGIPAIPVENDLAAKVTVRDAGDLLADLGYIS